MIEEHNDRVLVIRTGFLGKLMFDFHMMNINDFDALPYYHIEQGKRVKTMFISLFKKHGPWKVVVTRKETLKLQLRYGTEIKHSFNSFKDCITYIERTGL